MAWVNRILQGLRALFHAKRIEQELDDELRAFVDASVNAKLDAGMRRQDAVRAARLELGSEASVKDAVRDAGWESWVGDFWRDIAYARRSLTRSPGFTAVAVLTLAIGTGATTAIFSVVSGVLLKPLPYPNSSRIVRLFMNAPASESPSKRPLRASLGLTAAEINEVRTRVRTLSHVGTSTGILRSLRGHEEAARLQGSRVSASAFEMIDAQPMLGRVFNADDELVGAEPVMILSHAAWLRFFQGDRDVIGSVTTTDSVLGQRVESRYTVIGVMPQGFAYPEPSTQFWVPFAMSAPGAPPLRGPLVGRLADGVSVEAATAELSSALRGIRPEARETQYELALEHLELVAPVRPALWVLMSAVGCVLLIACVNVANLLLARSAARDREMAVRVALGAGRGRLVRQVLTESMMLSLLGGVVGVALAFGGVRILKQLATTISRIDLSPTAFPRIESIAIDLWTLVFAIVCTAATGVLFGLAPALVHSRVDPVRGLRGPSVGAGRSRIWRPSVRQCLVVSEVALAMMLLVGGGLLIRSFLKLSMIDPGYNAENVLTFQVSLPSSRYTNLEMRAFAETMVQRLRSSPGVEAAAYGNQLPMVNLSDTAGGLWTSPDPQRPPTPVGPDARIVSRDYLRVFGIPVVAGRGFNDGDGEGQRRVLLVNQTLVNKDFAGESPIGRAVFIGRDIVPWEIVGIVADVRQFGLDHEPTPQFFVDMRQWGVGGTFFPIGAYYAVRTNADPRTLLATARNTVANLDKEAALFNVAPMEDLIANTIARPRMYTALLGSFAAAGLLLALVGIYGVIAYTVTQRTREIGIRMSLGARGGNVTSLVLRQSFPLMIIGVSIGLVGAAMMSRFLETLLFGVKPLDAATFGTMALMFIWVAGLASYVPARRAAKVDPLVALRCD